MEVNQIYLGDCLNVMKNIDDKSIDMILCDPPYATITGGSTKGNRPKGILSKNDGLFKHQKIDHEKWIKECYRVLKKGSHCYIFSNTLNLSLLLNITDKVGFKLHNLLVWEKNNCTPSQYYMKNCEYILFLRKGNAKYINDIGGSKTVHKFNNIIGNKLHPTEKPIELMEFYIKNSSDEGDLVLDPFMGSGSTMVACINTNRQYIGIEKDEKYFEIAQKRIEEHKEKLSQGKLDL